MTDSGTVEVRDAELPRDRDAVERLWLAYLSRLWHESQSLGSTLGISHCDFGISSAACFIPRN